MSFKDYKNLRKEKFEELQKKITEEKNVGFQTDPDDWFPSVDKAGNGFAIVRLMPGLEVENGLPYVKWISHRFKNAVTGKWYTENSLKTHGNMVPDPLAEYNKILWDSTEDKNHPNRKQASLQARKQNVRVNLFVISDAADSSNNNKLKKHRFGKLLFEFIDKAITPPEIEGSIIKKEPLDPFDLFEGANLEITISTEMKNGKATRVYSYSWGQRGPLTKDNDALEKIYYQLQSEPDRWSLTKYIAEDKFKSYEELDKILHNVLGFNFRTGEKNKSEKSTNSTPAPQTRAVEHVAVNEAQSDQAFIDQVSQADEDEIPF